MRTRFVWILHENRVTRNVHLPATVHNFNALQASCFVFKLHHDHPLWMILVNLIRQPIERSWKLFHGDQENQPQTQTKWSLHSVTCHQSAHLVLIHMWNITNKHQIFSFPTKLSWFEAKLWTLARSNYTQPHDVYNINRAWTNWISHR